MMSKIIAIVLCLIVVLSIGIGPTTAKISNNNGGSPESNDKNTKRLIAHTTSAIDKLKYQSQGCSVIDELNDATVIECPKGVADKLDNVEEDRLLQIMDLQADIQIGADSVWNSGYNGTGITVAVLDTGVDTSHPELTDSIAGGKSFTRTSKNYLDQNGHGTHVSGIITANGIGGVIYDGQKLSKGVAPGTKIWMGKVCNPSGLCWTSDIAKGIEYVVTYKISKIISISLGGGGTTTDNCDTDYLAKKVNWAVNNGVTVFVAAGNNGASVSSPACASGAIAVGAVDKSDNRASFSGVGNALDIMAPGVSIYSTIPGNSYASWSGTSMATPHVAATIALMRQKNNSLTDANTKNILYSTAVKYDGWDAYHYGNGRVNASAAVAMVT